MKLVRKQDDLGDGSVLSQSKEDWAFRIPELMAFHGLKISASSAPLLKLSLMQLGAKARGKQSSKSLALA